MWKLKVNRQIGGCVVLCFKGIARQKEKNLRNAFRSALRRFSISAFYLLFISVLCIIFLFNRFVLTHHQKRDSLSVHAHVLIPAAVPVTGTALTEATGLVVSTVLTKAAGSVIPTVLTEAAEPVVSTALTVIAGPVARIVLAKSAASSASAVSSCTQLIEYACQIAGLPAAVCHITTHAISTSGYLKGRCVSRHWYTCDTHCSCGCQNK